LKRFFARYFLPIFPLLWSLVLLFAGFYNFFVNEFSRDIFLCFMGMGGAMLIASLLSFAAQAKDHKGIGAIAIVFSVVHFLPLFADVVGLRLFRGFVYLFSEIPCLLSILSLAIIAASNILVFCRNNIVPASPAIPDALAQQIQGLRADMGNVINKLRQIDDLKAALSTLEAKYQALEARLAEQPAAADAPAAAPAVSLEKAARKKPNLRKEEPTPVEEKPSSVPEIKAPVAEETNPVVETSVPVVEEATPVAKETPAAETIPPTSRPAPVQPTSQFALPGSKGTCTVYRNGIHYQLKGQDFFAPYEEIDNLYVTLGVYYMMYKGKDYHIDVYQRNGQEK